MRVLQKRCDRTTQEAEAARLEAVRQMEIRDRLLESRDIREMGRLREDVHKAVCRGRMMG